MPITPTLNTFLNYNNPSQPVLVSAASTALARGIQVTGGEKVTFNVYLVDATGASPTYVVPAEGDTVRFSAKENANDEELAYLFDEWTIYEDHVTCTADFATVEGFWTTSDGPAKSLIANFEVETESGLVRKWSFFLQIVHQSYGGEAPPVNPGDTYVKYTAQTPTDPQKSQARANIGAGTSNFDPASPGPIGGTTPSSITTTDATLGVGGTDPLIVTNVAAGNVNYAGLHNFLGTTTFGNAAQGQIDGNGAASFPTLSVGGNALSLGGNNVTFGTWGAGFVQAESSADALASLGIGAADDVSFGTVSASDLYATNSVSAGSGLAVLGSDGAITGESIDITNVANLGTLSVAGGTFSSDSSGNVNATTQKLNGASGVAGSLSLKQGTTASGTASYTSLWGISGGLGWRDGTGTAYSLTLPSATGTLALVSGNLGTPTTLTLTNATGLTVAGGGTGASTSVGARTNLALNRLTPVYANDAAWVTPSAISGVVSVNTYSTGARTGTVSTATAGFGRFYYNIANTCNIYTSARTTVNWSTSFRISFRALIYVNANASSKITILLATSTATVAHDLAALGLGIQAYGNGSACRIRLQSHNGTSATNGTDVAWTASDENFYDFELVWTAGTGATLYKDDVSLCSVATGLPSGNGAGGATCPMVLFENGAGSSDNTTVRLMYMMPKR